MKLIEVGDEMCLKILKHINEVIVSGRGQVVIDIMPTAIDITPAPRQRIKEELKGRTPARRGSSNGHLAR